MTATTSKLQIPDSLRLDTSVKRIIVSTIDHDWNQITEREQKEMCNDCIHLLDNELVDICNNLIRNVIGDFNPLVEDAIQSIQNLVKSSGLMFVDMLSQLRKHDKGKQLAIMSQLDKFITFWNDKLINITRETVVLVL